MAFTMPTFVSRIFRPFTSSGARLGIVADSAGEADVPPGAEIATLAAGCFWGVEHIYRQYFPKGAIYRGRVGFIGGHTENPTYQEVCMGDTGHAEAFQMHYDPTQITYRQIIELFYRMHDPTTIDQQGGDRGSQYRSAIFFHNEEQEKIAREITRKANEQWWNGRIVTELVPAPHFWRASGDHQQYLHHNPHGYQCKSHNLDRKLSPLQ